MNPAPPQTETEVCVKTRLNTAYIKYNAKVLKNRSYHNFGKVDTVTPFMTATNVI